MSRTLPEIVISIHPRRLKVLPASDAASKGVREKDSVLLPPPVRPRLLTLSSGPAGGGA